MKTQFVSNGLAVISFITAGLALTSSAKPQAHGHQHGGVFGRNMHNSKVSSGSSLNINTLGAADSQTLYAARSDVAVLIYPLEFVAVFPTATGTTRGSNCLGADCDSMNATYYSRPFARPTPVPQLQLQPLEAQGDQSADFSSRRRNRYRTSEATGKAEASSTTHLVPASTSTEPAQASSKFRLIHHRISI